MKNNTKIKILKSGSSSFLDYPDNKHLAIIVYILGCAHDCYGCQNPKLQNIMYSDANTVEVTINEFKNNLEKLALKYRTNKLVLSGGDPLFPDNLDFIKEFLTTTIYDVCIYTGYSIEYVQELNISNFKFLKCGKYISALHQVSEKTDDYLQFSSKNQKLYNDKFKLISKNGRYYFCIKED